jgi:hypothetical protein
MSIKFICHPNKENIDNFYQFINRYFIYDSELLWDVYKTNIVPSGFGLSNDPLIKTFDSKREYIFKNLKSTISYNNKDITAFKLIFPNCIFIPIPEEIPKIFSNYNTDIHYYSPVLLYIERY